MKPLSDIDHALALLQLGRYKPALRAAKIAQNRFPASPVPHNIAGIATASLGNQRAALTWFSKALRLDAGFVDARRNLAQTLILLGQYDRAEPHLENLTTHAPDDSGAWYLLAQCHLAQGDVSRADHSASQAVKAAPNQARNFNLRGVIRDRAGDLSGAFLDFETALGLEPDNVDALVNISLPLARQTRFDEAFAALQRAIAVAPDHLGGLLRLGAHHVQTGDTKAAIATFLQVLKRHPGTAEAIEQLALLLPFPDAPDLSALAEAALKTAPKRSEARASLLFAQAYIAEQTKDLQSAATLRKAANGTMAQVLPYDAAADSGLTDRILHRFRDIIPASETLVQPPVPVFVLGLPRSGTTLAEAILGAHPAIAPLGERATAGILLQKVINQDLPFDAPAIETFQTADRSLRPDLPTGITAYVDKMPENYRLIGFLKSAYPQAKIIQITRDPRDVALSMWKGHFSGTALNYTYDLPAMAHRFNLYARMMAHWHRVLPGQILTVDYNDMVTSTSEIGKQMAEFCELDWHPDMARPYETTNQILTLSATQLRQPVHTRSIGGWRQHKDELVPFINGLDPNLWPGL